MVYCINITESTPSWWPKQLHTQSLNEEARNPDFLLSYISFTVKYPIEYELEVVEYFLHENVRGCQTLARIGMIRR